MKSFLKFFIVYSVVTFFAFTFNSCQKEGTGGKSTVNGNVKHHTKLIPNADVYIKYGATEFPGADVSSYDDHVQADANAHYEFKELRKGDYYIYGVGVDNAGPYTVVGGTGIKLRRNEDLNIDVPVTE